MHVEDSYRWSLRGSYIAGTTVTARACRNRWPTTFQGTIKAFQETIKGKGRHLHKILGINDHCCNSTNHFNPNHMSCV